MDQTNPGRHPGDAWPMGARAARRGDQIAALAQQHFGIDRLARFQLEAIEAALDGHDSLIVQPTGSGKSLCFVLPSLLQPGLTLVISPLVALMVDQVAGLLPRGVRAAQLHRDLSFREAAVIERQAEQAQLDVLFAAPERLQSPHFLSVLRRCKLGLVAIDEAHCLSTWGQEFRPDYRAIEPALAQLERVPRMALTATASDATRRDIVHTLGLCEPLMLLASPLRRNLLLTTGFRQRGYKQLLGLLDRPLPTTTRQRAARGAPGGESPGKTIVYVPTRAGVDQLQQQLSAAGRSVASYHAGLNSQQRADAQTRFASGDCQLLLATVAFGLGVNIPDIRRVIRLGLPASLEALLQEAGRAGRDGRSAQMLVLFNERDVGWLMQQNPASAPDLLQFLLAEPVARPELVDELFDLARSGPPAEPPPVALPRPGCPPALRQILLGLAADFAEQCSASFIADLLAGKTTASVTQRGGHRHRFFALAQEDDGLRRHLPHIRLLVRDLLAEGALLIDPETGYLRPTDG